MITPLEFNLWIVFYLLFGILIGYKLSSLNTGNQKGGAKW